LARKKFLYHPGKGNGRFRLRRKPGTPLRISSKKNGYREGHRPRLVERREAAKKRKFILSASLTPVPDLGEKKKTEGLILEEGKRKKMVSGDK